MPEISQQHRNLALETPLGSEVLLIERVVGHDALASLFEFRISAVATIENDPSDDLVGKAVTLRLEVDESTTRHFNGLVSQLAHLGFDRRGFSRYELVVVPWLWILTRTADCRIFQKMKVPEILTAVFSEAGFSDYELRLTGSYPTRDYCVQYRETDFNFVQRLMEHEGIYYFWEHENGKHRMILCDAMSAHKEVQGAQTLLYRTEGGIQEGYTIHSWKSRQRITSGAYVMNSFNFESPGPSPTSRLIGKSNRKHQHAFGDEEIYDNPGDYFECADGERLAKVRCEEVQTEKKTITTESDARWLSVGYLFTTDEIPRSDQNGDYLVTAMSFQAEGGNYGSGTGSGEDLFSCTVSAIPKDSVFRPARLAVAPKVQGPQTAMVVGPSGEEIYTDKHGRVKVQFLWDRYGKFDAGSSCWIRVSQAWAGKGWGGITIPRIGHEVVVEFLEGDPDRPIITGRVYNGDHPVPYELPKEATKSTLKSRSSPDGGTGHNELRFEDKKGGEQVYIHAQKDMDVRVRNNLKETNYGSRHERIGWRKDGGHGGSHFVTIHEDENTHVEEKHYEMVDNDSHLKVKGEHTEKFEKSQMTHVAQKHVLNATESIIETSQSISLKSGVIKLQGSMGAHLLGQQIVLEGTSLCIKSGGNFISVSPAGIDIQGVMVKINSGGVSSPAQKPSALPEISVLEPYDASVADNTKGGGKIGYGGGRPPRGGGPIAPILAPPYTPPPDVPPDRRIPPAPPAPPTTPCSVRTLDVTCDHPASGPKRRAEGGRLQIVPTSGMSTVTTGLQIRSLISVRVQQGGRGTDVIHLRMENNEGSDCQKEVALTRAGSPAAAEWRGGTTLDETVNTPPAEGLWLDGVSPVTYHAYGRGRRDESPASVQIEAFPCYTVQGSVDLSFFAEAARAINEAFKRTVRRGLGAIEIEPQLTLPTGNVTFGCGWKEHTDWRAYYSWELSAGLEPLVGVALQVRPNLLALAGTAVGIPPQLTNYAASIFIHLQIGGSVGMSGRVAKVGPENIEGGVRGNGQLFIELGLGVRAGDEALLRGELVGSGRTGVTLFLGFSYRTGPSGGLLLQPRLDWNGLTVTVRLVTHAFGVEVTNSELVTWNVFDSSPIWEPPHPWYIVAND